ncbi:MAG: nucleotide-binding protein [Bacteroidaceae bacterium]|nr:nucleotide-binding protein [Bacteroidaceae bacterium]MEA5099735.1 nucleotide-binding protein [Bacteroidales bacterium]
MIKRKLFIGSSTEGKNIAEKIKIFIEDKCKDWIEVICWSDDSAFQLGKTTLENLQEKAMLFDYGIFVATKDDASKSRQKKYLMMRDNVLFEAGMFLATLGKERAFILFEEKCKVPSDLSGETLSFFNRKDDSSINISVSKIIKSLENTRDTYKFAKSSSTALALGYYKNYVSKVISEVVNKDDRQFSMNIYIPLYPKNVDNIKYEFKSNTNSVEQPLYSENIRPTVCKTKDGNNWDIPTTTEIIFDIIDKIVMSSELKTNKYKEYYIENEVINFSYALKSLIKDDWQNIEMINIYLLNKDGETEIV